MAGNSSNSSSNGSGNGSSSSSGSLAVGKWAAKNPFAMLCEMPGAVWWFIFLLNPQRISKCSAKVPKARRSAFKHAQILASSH